MADDAKMRPVEDGGIYALHPLAQRLTVWRDGVPYPAFGLLNPTARGHGGAGAANTDQLRAALGEVERFCGALVPAGQAQTLLLPPPTQQPTNRTRWPSTFASDDPTRIRTIYMLLDCLQCLTSLLPDLNQIVADYCALARTRHRNFISPHPFPPLLICASGS
jgi:hypothetical protein